MRYPVVSVRISANLQRLDARRGVRPPPDLAVVVTLPSV